ncbi:MAG: hypothetical protein KF767_05630 [Bdellovibrionaceae bacterium]|nr:hypothetical protein [Pseudobdellovibrionaceae bacterium]
MGHETGYEGTENVGKWVPENSATNVEAQVVAYAIGRYLQMSRLVVPSAYHQGNGAMLEKFRAFMQNAVEKNKWRIINRDNLLAALARNPQTMLGVVTMDIRNEEVASLVDAARNTINSAHPVAQFIRADGARPSPTAMMSFAGVKTRDGKTPVNTELLLAREFSQIMVLDILCGQWDRWSGGNVEATWSKEGELHFIARDNGGAALSSSTQVSKYLQIVSRFDRAQIERVRALEQALAADPDGTAKSLKMWTKPKALQGRIRALLAHVEAMRARYGDAQVFF